MYRRLIYVMALVSTFAFLISCEEVIDIDLNSSGPAFAVEATIYKDSVCQVRLTQTTNYFSTDRPGIIENAYVKIYDGTITEELVYKGNGYYSGETIIGTEGRTYEIEILYNGITYKGVSSLPKQSEIVSVRYIKDSAQSIFNPEGDIVFTITCEFTDNPETKNYYMIRFIRNGANIEDSYYLLTRDIANQGVINYVTDSTISYSESVFDNGGPVEVKVFSIDETMYNYFLQLNDVLFWKHRIMPPTPYNPHSNINKGALGFFAAWSFDSEIISLD